MATEEGGSFLKMKGTQLWHSCPIHSSDGELLSVSNLASTSCSVPVSAVTGIGLYALLFALVLVLGYSLL